MNIDNLPDWIADKTFPGFQWFIKRLSGNDTTANGAHQAGPYLPREFLFRVAPELHKPTRRNPDVSIALSIDSHCDERDIRAVWYNNKFFGGTRNETRLTGFGGASSALLNPENTGAIAMFVFGNDAQGTQISCATWVCRDTNEEDLVEERFGPIEPGNYITWPERIDNRKQYGDTKNPSCRLEPRQIPAEWLSRFPSGEEIIRKVIDIRNPNSFPKPDQRLLARRACEYELYQSVESEYWMPRIRKKFDTIGSLLSVAQSILQSRKTRSGKSLELHIREIFIETGLVPNIHFQHSPRTEQGKRPDFLFPSQLAYEDNGFPGKNLRMLAVKTTCKDRWRQILNEADRIPEKHLLTLQEGVSENQFREMRSSGVRLVVPRGLWRKYPEKIRSKLVSVEAFLKELESIRS